MVLRKVVHFISPDDADSFSLAACFSSLRFRPRFEVLGYSTSSSCWTKSLSSSLSFFLRFFFLRPFSSPFLVFRFLPFFFLRLSSGS